MKGTGFLGGENAGKSLAMRATQLPSFWRQKKKFPFAAMRRQRGAAEQCSGTATQAKKKCFGGGAGEVLLRMAPDAN